MNTPKPPARETVPDKPSLEPAPKKHEIDVDLTQDTRSSKKPSKSADNAAESRAAAQSAARAASKKLAQEVAEAFAGLDSNLHSTEPASKVVALSAGTGGEGGGEAFVNYDTAIFNAYYRAWVTPDGTTHNLAVTDAKIVVQRDGTVTFAEIVNKSGDAAIDRSVQRALSDICPHSRPARWMPSEVLLSDLTLKPNKKPDEKITQNCSRISVQLRLARAGPADH